MAVFKGLSFIYLKSNLPVNLQSSVMNKKAPQIGEALDVFTIEEKPAFL